MYFIKFLKNTKLFLRDPESSLKFTTIPLNEILHLTAKKMDLFHLFYTRDSNI